MQFICGLTILGLCASPSAMCQYNNKPERVLMIPTQIFKYFFRNHFTAAR